MDGTDEVGLAPGPRPWLAKVGVPPCPSRSQQVPAGPPAVAKLPLAADQPGTHRSHPGAHSTGPSRAWISRPQSHRGPLGSRNFPSMTRLIASDAGTAGTEFSMRCCPRDRMDHGSEESGAWELTIAATHGHFIRT